MLPTQKGNGSGDMEQCCICMDDMKPRQSITRLPACLHTFHRYVLQFHDAADRVYGFKSRPVVRVRLLRAVCSLFVFIRWLGSAGTRGIAFAKLVLG